MLCGGVGTACYRFAACAEDVYWRKIIYFETGFYITAQAGLKLMVVPLLQPLSGYMYITKPSFFL